MGGNVGVQQELTVEGNYNERRPTIGNAEMRSDDVDLTEGEMT